MPTRIPTDPTPSLHDHHRAHGGHADHARHGVVSHAPAPGTPAAYREALEGAHPDAGRRVIAVEFEAREVEGLVTPGFTAWTFNGQVPGPLLEGRVGDVLEVRLTNRLPEPTSIHWHGLRLPAPMDGTDMTQAAVAPGESFTYRFRLGDAGTYWYHSHTNEMVQMERGLYGALIVRADGEPVLDEEQVLVFDDLKLDRKGRLAPFGGFVQWHDGREGDVRLINGRVEPELAIAAGQIERWRLINASSARYLRFSLGKASFRILGTGGGPLGAPLTANEVLLAPGDRADLAVGPFEEDRTLPIESLPYWRTTVRRRKTERFGSLRVGPSAHSMAAFPASARPVAPLAPADAVPTRRVEFGVRYSLRRGMDFVVNGRRHDRDAPVKVGELQVWDIVNSTLMDHPFHLHGFSFQVLAVDGVARESLSWEDVVNLPPRSTTRIAWMPDDRPGSWMYHCHILEHHAAGMMAHFDVVR